MPSSEVDSLGSSPSHPEVDAHEVFATFCLARKWQFTFPPPAFCPHHGTHKQAFTAQAQAGQTAQSPPCIRSFQDDAAGSLCDADGWLHERREQIIFVLLSPLLLLSVLLTVSHQTSLLHSTLIRAPPHPERQKSSATLVLAAESTGYCAAPRCQKQTALPPRASGAMTQSHSPFIEALDSLLRGSGPNDRCWAKARARGAGQSLDSPMPGAVCSTVTKDVHLALGRPSTAIMLPQHEQLSPCQCQQPCLPPLTCPGLIHDS